jgi:hypothetical protein
VKTGIRQPVKLDAATLLKVKWLQFKPARPRPAGQSAQELFVLFVLKSVVKITHWCPPPGWFWILARLAFVVVIDQDKNSKNRSFGSNQKCVRHFPRN